MLTLRERARRALMAGGSVDAILAELTGAAQDMRELCAERVEGDSPDYTDVDYTAANIRALPLPEGQPLPEDEILAYNRFRHIDALEYASAWNAVEGLDIPAIEARLQRLNGQMDELKAEGRPIPTYLLAAYRGYEFAIAFRLNPSAFNQPTPNLVKLDDRG